MTTPLTPFLHIHGQKLVFGAGRFKTLPEHIPGSSGTVALITSGHFAQSGAFASLVQGLTEKGFRTVTFTVRGEPSPDTVNTIRKDLGIHPVKAVIAVGGGSVLDAGKAVSVMLKHEGNLEEYLEGVGRRIPSGDKVFFAAVPTTAGTGSEATKNAVISRVGPGGFKKSLRHERFVPDLALVDPELALSCPPGITAACGMDAFSQLVESFISSGANPMTDALAWAGLESLLSAFPGVVHNGSDLEARSRMAFASYLSGVTLANAGIGAVHGMAGPLGGFFPIPHGTACANLLPGVLEATLAGLGEDSPAGNKLARIGRLFPGGDDLPRKEAAKYLIVRLFEWQDRLEISPLSSYGVTEKDLPRIIEASDNKQNPVKLTEVQMNSILSSRLY
jgi:alcohol dehydrogenase class IV